MNRASFVECAVTSRGARTPFKAGYHCSASFSYSDARPRCSALRAQQLQLDIEPRGVGELRVSGQQGTVEQCGYGHIGSVVGR